MNRRERREALLEKQKENGMNRADQRKHKRRRVLMLLIFIVSVITNALIVCVAFSCALHGMPKENETLVYLALLLLLIYLAATRYRRWDRSWVEIALGIREHKDLTMSEQDGEDIAAIWRTMLRINHVLTFVSLSLFAVFFLRLKIGHFE